MSDLCILFQAYAEKARQERYEVTDCAVRFRLEQGDEWPKDKGRSKYKYDRIELSIKPESNPCAWLEGKNEFCYSVAAPWEIAAQKCGEGHVILGQIHAGAPLFSLRWAPFAKPGEKRLWADFMTHNKDHSYGFMILNELLNVLENQQPISVNLITKDVGDALYVDAEISAASVTKSFRCGYYCYPVLVDPNQSSGIRFKIGAYRTRKDHHHWDSLEFIYTNIKINSECINLNCMKNARYDN